MVSGLVDNFVLTISFILLVCMHLCYESVSLRTMLNFNRIFEQQMLRKIKSPYAIKPIEIGGKGMAKTFAQSVQSFVATLPDAVQKRIAKTDAADLAASDMPINEFKLEFIRIHKVDPKEEGKN